METLEQWMTTIERKWAILSGFKRKEILVRAGHHELFSMTASSMTITKITEKFGENVAEQVVSQI